MLPDVLPDEIEIFSLARGKRAGHQQLLDYYKKGIEWLFVSLVDLLP